MTPYAKAKEQSITEAHTGYYGPSSVPKYLEQGTVRNLTYWKFRDGSKVYPLGNDLIFPIRPAVWADLSLLD